MKQTLAYPYQHRNDELNYLGCCCRHQPWLTSAAWLGGYRAVPQPSMVVLESFHSAQQSCYANCETLTALSVLHHSAQHISSAKSLRNPFPLREAFSRTALKYWTGNNPFLFTYCVPCIMRYLLIFRIISTLYVMLTSSYTIEEKTW